MLLKMDFSYNFPFFWDTTMPPICRMPPSLARSADSSFLTPMHSSACQGCPSVLAFIRSFLCCAASFCSIHAMGETLTKLPSSPDQHPSWKPQTQGTWVAQSGKCPTLDVGSGHELMIHGFEPRIGFYADSVEPAWDSLSLLSFSVPPLPCSPSLSNKPLGLSESLLKTKISCKITRTSLSWYFWY